jgi:hypothetical protein
VSTERPATLRLWMVTVVLSVAALVLGVVGFSRYLGHGAGAGSEFTGARFFDLLYYTLQLFVLGPSPFGGPPYDVPLSLAMYLAPLATVLAVVATVSAAFRDRLAAWRVSRRSGHTVVVGTTPEAWVLAQRLAEPAGGTSVRRPRTSAQTVVLVGSGIDRDLARRHDLRVVSGEPIDKKTLRAAGVPAAARVFALAASGAANAAVALHVRSLHEKLAPGTDIAVYARVNDAELVAAMRARRLGAEGDQGFRVDFFNLETIAAVALLDEHRPGPDAVIVGSDRFALAVRGELERRRRRAAVPDPVPLVACDDAGSLAAPPDGSTYVCTTDADDVLRVGLNLLLAGHPRVVLCLGRRAALAGALEQKLFDRVGGQLSVFGILDAACDPDRLASNALIEQLARALHAHYLREYGGAGQASQVAWDTLEDRFKDDNREQADDIGAKLASIQALIVPAAPGLPTFSLTDDEVEKLAELEHDRWVENKRRAGIVHGAERTATTHPDMLAWDTLDEGVKEKDRMFVRGLPALLEAEDLAIVRRAGGGGSST